MCLDLLFYLRGGIRTEAAQSLIPENQCRRVGAEGAGARVAESLTLRTCTKKLRRQFFVLRYTTSVKKYSSILKMLLVAVIAAAVGYIGLDIPREDIEEVVHEQFEKVASGQVGQAENDQSYQVVSVIDGDTIKVLQGGEIATVRLVGIDAPETKYSERGEECYGEESMREAAELLEDSYVTLELDGTQASKDKYGRILAYVRMEDGRDFGQVMIEGGFAQEYTYDNPYQHQQTYQMAEESARAAVAGLWGCEQ